MVSAFDTPPNSIQSSFSMQSKCPSSHTHPMSSYPLLTPLTSKLLHAETQSSLPFLSTWPNHCSLLRLTIYVMHSLSSQLLSSALAFLLHKWTSPWPSFGSLQSCPFYSPSFTRISIHSGYRPCILFLTLSAPLDVRTQPVPLLLPLTFLLFLHLHHWSRPVKYFKVKYVTPFVHSFYIFVSDHSAAGRICFTIC